MNLHHVRIEAPDGIGGTASVHLDGQRLRSVTSVTARVEPDSLVIVELELAIPALEFDGNASITLPDGTVATLIELGWTPPEGE